MATFFRTMGRLTGYAVRSHAVDRAVSRASQYLLREMKLADVKLKLAMLKQKRTRHIKLLGKTVYHLVCNDIPPFDDEHTQIIMRVLVEIDNEIDMVQTEMKRRRETYRREKKASAGDTD